jgi:ParB/RepB/Spo0J family partition protein
MAKKLDTKSAGESKIIPLSDIFVDREWNARSGSWEQNEKFKILLEGIKLEGVQDPVDVVRSENVPEIRTTKSYVLIAGFRRYEASKQLKMAGIPALIKNVSYADARIRNIQENVHREDVSVADQIASLLELGQTACNKDVASRTGLSLSWVSSAIALGSKLDPQVLQLWRTSNLLISAKLMKQVADSPKDKQLEVFNTLVGELKTQGSPPRGKWVETAIRRASVFGQDVGILIGYGVLAPIALRPTDWDLGLAIKVGKYPAGSKASDENKLAIIESFMNGVSIGESIVESAQDAETAEMNEEKEAMCPGSSVPEGDSLT